MGTFAGKPAGSGANFSKLKSTLAARGAHNPGALAAWIGRRKYGKRRFAKLGHMHSNLMFAEPYEARADETVRCPNCGAMNAPDAKYCDQCGHKLPNDAEISGENGNNRPAEGDQYRGGGSSALQTQARGDYYGRTGFSGQQVTVRGQGGAPSGGRTPMQYANGGRAIELARRMPVTTPDDLVVSRSPSGSAIIRHRRGGDTLGEIKHRDDGKWISVTADGKELPEFVHQRSALLSLIRTYNTGTVTLQHGAALQPPPQQTPLMQQFGIPAIRLATPSNGASDGPRMTESSGDDLSGLSPKGVSIYRKLIKRGFPAARAKAFASRAQNFGGAGK